MPASVVVIIYIAQPPFISSEKLIQYDTELSIYIRYFKIYLLPHSAYLAIMPPMPALPPNAMPYAMPGPEPELHGLARMVGNGVGNPS